MSDDMISQEEIDALLNGGLAGADGDDKPADDAAASEAAPAAAALETASLQARNRTSDRRPWFFCFRTS